jgi:predicted HicB family RNase H-like nuclease
MGKKYTKQHARRESGKWFVEKSRSPHSYSISDNLHDNLKVLARDQEVSVSMLAEEAIYEYVQKQVKKV